MFSGYDFFDEDGELSGTVFRDVFLGFAAMVLLLFIVALIWINEPEQEHVEENKTRGNVRVELIWPNDLNSDVDLWCQAPGDTPVGWSNKGSPIFNLVRDDLGNAADFSDVNYEIQFSRGLPKGEWICNAHWYANKSIIVNYNLDGLVPKLPKKDNKKHNMVPLKVIVTVRKEDNSGKKIGNIEIIEYDSHKLVKVRQEITLVRFRLDDNGNIEEGSVNNIFKSIMIKSNHPREF